MKVGFVILLSVPLATSEPPRYTEIRNMARLAESAGFDSIWLYDHLLYRAPSSPTRGIWECWTMLTALAEATERVEIGTLVLCSSFRNPALLAKMAATLDEVSEGRLILGLGAGWNEPEFRAFGIPLDYRVSRFEEALQIIAPLVREGAVDFSGKYYRALDCEVLPRGPREKGPPILIGSAGPRMLRLSARYADLWSPMAYLSNVTGLGPSVAAFKEACLEVGRDPQSVELTALIALAYPDLATPPANPYIPEYLTGTPEAIAETMRDFERMGTAHVMFHIAPNRVEALERLALALQLYRRSR